MKRFDYRVTTLRLLTGFELPAAFPQRLRGPLVALAVSVAIVAVGCAVQAVRLRAADRQATQYALQVATAERSVAQIRSLEADVMRLRALVSQVDEIRRSGPARASELAALGNNLPADAWFTSIRVERDTIAVEGRGTRLASAGAALGALARLRSYAGARLTNVRDDPSRAGVTYAIVLEPAR